jgi:hypothetical protein
MQIPAGKHTIEYRFEPQSVATGERITLVSSKLLYGGALAVAIAAFLRRKKQQA